MSKFKLLFLVLLIGSLTYAQNVNDALRLGYPGLGSNARALGMGNAFLGISDDASAVFFNPAGLGLIRRIELSGGIDYSNFSNDVTLFNSSKSSSNSSGRLNRVSFALPFPTYRGSLVFAVGYHNSKDFTGITKFDGFNNRNTSWIQEYAAQKNSLPYDLYLSDDLNDNSDQTIINGRLNQSGSILNSGSINNWSFAGALEVQRNLYVGLNLNVITGEYESNNDYYEDDVQNIYQGVTVQNQPSTTDFRTFYLNRIINWDINGWDAKLGVLYQLENIGRISAAVQFPKSYYIKETFDVNARADYANATYSIDPEYYSDAVEYTITTPMELSGGFSLNFQGLIFSAEGTFIDYSQTEFSEPVNLTQRDLDNVNKDIKDQLSTALNYNLGLEYTIPKINLRLRGGYFVQQSAYMDDPPEFDKNFLTAGIGFLTENNIGIDLAYVRGWWEDFGDNYGSGVSRTFQEIVYNKFVLTGTFRF